MHAIQVDRRAGAPGTRGGLAEMGRHLADDLAGRYRTALVPAERPRTRCPEERAACLLDAAGGDFVLAGVVHRSSTLILQIFVRVADARTGRSRFARDLDVRGDSDEGWRRDLPRAPNPGGTAGCGTRRHRAGRHSTGIAPATVISAPEV